MRVGLTVLPPHPCPYLPDRTATLRAFATAGLDGDLYHRFMDAGFRRSGRMVYQPVCDGCRLCVPIRVPVGQFLPNKTQRRTVRRNADLTVTSGPPTFSDEKFAVYRRYVGQWHDRTGEDADDPAAFQSFLYHSPVDSLEFTYRDDGGRLLAVGIADVCRQSFSSVYFYFDPGDADRSPGTFGALYEIDWCRQAGIPHYYLGYWVAGCRKMAYKANFRPCEMLAGTGQWGPAVGCE